MENILIEQLHNAGYLCRGKPMYNKIRRASLSNILDLTQQSCEITSAQNIPREHTIFSQSASLSLGCGRWPCSSIECRLDHAEQLAQYAVLYGDRVYIRNFLADYMQHYESRHYSDVDSLRRRFTEDLILLSYLKPVIEAGLIVPITPPNYCLHCLAKNSLGLKDDKPLKKAMRVLTTKFEDSIHVAIARKGKGLYTIIANGPEELLDHGFYCRFSDTPPPILKRMPQILSRVKRGENVPLSRSELHRSGIAEMIANDHYRSIIFELSLAQCLGTGFLTDWPLHIQFLKNLSQNLPGAERDLMIEKHLNCLVPFAKELSLSEILVLRNQEQDAFVMFKKALSNAVEEYRSKYGTFTEKDAKTVYTDMIKPSLAKLETKIRKSRNLLIKGTTRKILAWTAIISTGLYTGFLPQGLVSAAAALGLTKVLAEITENLLNKSNVEETIRDQDLYFLWRLNKKSRSN